MFFCQRPTRGGGNLNVKVNVRTFANFRRVYSKHMPKCKQQASSGLTQKRTEERAPLWGSEFTRKAAALQERGQQNSFPAVYVDLGPVVTRARI